ncbi:GAF domain-containing protein [Streptomyces sp. NPDC051322]|uniref:helix-turn-helix domain-containing protein n=1 Tax=Streptomyces sp. NPDC051322 TaxID=3154645 RepID=UPI00344D1CDE
MPLGDSETGDEQFRFLELLATEAPLEEFDERIRHAHRRGATPEEIERLTRAKQMSLTVHELFSRRQQREAGLAALVDTARELTLPYELDALLKVITRRARRLLNLDMSWVTLNDPADGNSRVRAPDGHASSITVGFRIPDDGGIGNEAARSSAPMWTSDYLSDERFAHSEFTDKVTRAEGLRAFMVVPLLDGNSATGVLYVAGRNVRHFTPEEVTLMASLGDFATIAIEKARLLDRTRAEVSQLEQSAARARGSSSNAQQLRDVQSGLIDVVLQGRGLRALVTEAAQQLGGSLLVRDPVDKPIVGVGDFPPLDEAQLLSASLDAHDKGETVQTADGRCIHPITAGKENLGTLVFHVTSPPTDYQVRLLPSVAQSVAVLLLMQRSTAAAEGQVRDELFNDLLSATRQTAQIEERAHQLGMKLEDPHVIVIARPEGGVQGRAVVWASSYANRFAGLKRVDSGCVGFLLPGSDAEGAAAAVARELTSVLGQPVTAGAAGPVTSPASVLHTYREAERCLDALTVLGGVGTSASPQQLGFLGLLLSDNRDVAGFVRTAIGPVLDYDTQQSTDLLRTLQAYFAAGNSPTRAAEELHVHPNTVSRRLERITELLGAHWQVPSRALEIQLALRLQGARHTLAKQREMSAKSTRK